MMIVEMVLTNHRSTARAKAEPASEIFSLATMGTAFHEFTFVTETTIAWITVTKTTDTNVVRCVCFSFYIKNKTIYFLR